MKAVYSAIITPMEDGSGYFCRVPDLPGCVTDGEDLDEALEMVTDAANGWLAGDEDAAPPPTPQSELEVPEGSIVTLVPIDTIAYLAETETKAVQKTVSLPAWMANMAAKKKINCSKVLQDGLLAILDA